MNSKKAEEINGVVRAFRVEKRPLFKQSGPYPAPGGQNICKATRNGGKRRKRAFTAT